MTEPWLPISRTNTGVFDFGTWNHLAVTVDRTTGEVAYLLQRYRRHHRVSHPIPAFKNNDVIRLGQMTNNSFSMQGMLDDVRIYNKVLSQPEIAAVMSGVTPVTVNAPSSA